MLKRPAERLPLTVDFLNWVSPSCAVVAGWFAQMRHDRAQLRLTAQGVPLPTLVQRDFPCPDLGPIGGPAVTGRGFLLVVYRPPDQPLSELVLESSSGAHALPLPVANIGPPLHEALQCCHWAAVFHLLQATTRFPLLRALGEMAEGGTPPVFAGWLSKVPDLPPSAEHVLGFSRLEAIAAPSGEYAIALRLQGGETVRAISAVALPCTGSPVTLDGPPLLIGEGAAVFYGHASEAAMLPWPVGAVIVEVQRADGENVWFRTTPLCRAASDFLAALSGMARQAVNNDVLESLNWLQEVLEERKRIFAPLLTARPAAVDEAAALPVAFLCGMEDPLAVRLALLAAAEIERRAAAIVVVGAQEVAAAIAEVFLQRGKVPVRTGFDLVQAVRYDTYGRCALVAIDSERLAKAVSENDFAALFARSLPGWSLRFLLRVASVAGRVEGEEVITRMVKTLEGRMFDRPPTSGTIDLLLAEHVEDFWSRALANVGVLETVDA